MKERREVPLPIVIRPYTDDDYKSVEANLKAAEMFDDIRSNQENLRSMMEADPESILIATIDDRIAGNLFIINFGVNFAFLFRIAVNENFREQGVGTRLLMSAEEVLKKRGAKEVALFVDSEKTHLPGYYESQGYNRGRSYLRMWKTL